MSEYADFGTQQALEPVQNKRRWQIMDVHVEVFGTEGYETISLHQVCRDSLQPLHGPQAVEFLQCISLLVTVGTFLPDDSFLVQHAKFKLPVFTWNALQTFVPLSYTLLSHPINFVLPMILSFSISLSFLFRYRDVSTCTYTYTFHMQKSIPFVHQQDQNLFPRIHLCKEIAGNNNIG